jgi:hypothetical protein
VLKLDRKLVVFPLISGVCCLVILASYAVPAFISGQLEPPGKAAPLNEHVKYYLPWFLLYLCNYFVIIFFNSIIVAQAAVLMQGGNPTVAGGFRTAIARLPLIIGWALFSATVGLALHIIEDRFDKLGKWIADLLDTVWSLTSFLVVPILVIEGKGPISAFKESARLLKKTWGEQLTGGLGLGLIFFLLMIPAIAVFGLTAAAYFGYIPAGSLKVLFPAAGLALIYLIALSSVSSALSTIFQTALFLYARDNLTPPGFESDMLSNAMVRK